MAQKRSILNTFAYITTGVVFGAAVFISIFEGNSTISVDILWEILGISFLSSMGNFIYYSNNEERYSTWTKRQLMIRTILHYLYINAIVLGSGLAFHWFYWYRIDMMAVMIAIILVVFALIWSINFFHDKKLAIQLNEKLMEHYQKSRD